MLKFYRVLFLYKGILWYDFQKHKRKDITELAKTLWLFVLKVFQRKGFHSMVMSGSLKLAKSSLNKGAHAKSKIQSLQKVILYSQTQNLLKSAFWFWFKIKFLKILSTVFVFVREQKVSFYTLYFAPIASDQAFWHVKNI